jgi:solute carrier family 25 protein 39/40
MKRRLTRTVRPAEAAGDTAKAWKKDLSARLLSSSVGSIVTVFAVTPLDVAKVRLQTLVPAVLTECVAAGGALSQAVSPAVSPAPPSSCITSTSSLCPRGCGALVGWNQGVVCQQRPYSALAATSTTTTTTNMTTWRMLRQIGRQEGWAGLYRGLRPTLLMAVPNTMLYYTAYDEIVHALRHTLTPPHDGGQAYAPLLAGGSARLLSSTLTAPLEYLRTREASLGGTAEGSSSSSLSSIRKIVQTQGLSSLYRGLAPTLWRDVPFSAIYWCTLEALRQSWGTTNESSRALSSDTTTSSLSREFLQSFLNGMVAGSVAACCTTPFDVVKTRAQAASSASSTANSRGTWPALRHVLATEGVTGLWRGNAARVTKVAPACAIMISSYELGKRLLLE